MKHILKDCLLVLTAVTLTATTAFAMEAPSKTELHTSAQPVASVKAEEAPKVETATPTESTPEKVPAETPVAEIAATQPDPVPETPKVDSTIPARVFCGSPAQRSWKSPLLANATIGRDMAAAKGWTGAQWDALLELWSCESSWNNFAQNPSSAFGIAQFLDSTWGLPGLAYANCQKTVDAREQIRCGLEYIAVVYGTPQNALAKHYRDNSY